MLNQLRNASKTWIAGAFIALLVASFAIWGVSDIFTGGARDTAVLVGKDRITTSAVRAAFERELNRISQQSDGALDRETAIALGLDQQIISQLAARSAFAQRTEDLGLTASESAVVTEIASIEAFIDPFTGRFDRQGYLQLLAQNGLTPQEFEADTRSSIVDRQLAAVLQAGVRAPDVLTEARARYEQEERALSIVAIPADAAGEIAPPTEAELEAFYAERETAYTLPPRRAFSLVMLDIDGFINDAPVEEDAIREAYEIERARLSTPELRDIVELAAPDEETAAEAALRLRAGEEPDAIALALGLPAPTTYDDAVPGDLLVSEVAETAFETDLDMVSDPIDGGISWFVVRIDEIIPGEEPSYEEAREELRIDLASGQATELLFDAIDAFEAARDRGARLEDAAQAARLPVFSYGLVDSRGADADGVVADLFTNIPEILPTVFSQQAIGAMTELIELGNDGFFVVRVDDIAPSEVRPLADVEDEVREDYLAAERESALDALAETAHAALEAGEGPTAAAAAVGQGARGETSQLNRAEPTATITPNVLGIVFAAQAGDVVTARAPGGGRVVVRIDDISQSTSEADAESEDAIRARLRLELANDLGEMFQNALLDAYPVSVNQELLDQATGANPGQ